MAFLDAEIDIDVIRNQNLKNVIKQGRKALKLWSRKNSAGATVVNLKRSLKAISRNDIILAIINSDQ